jgi:cytochrome c oxidase subunit 2
LESRTAGGLFVLELVVPSVVLALAFGMTLRVASHREPPASAVVRITGWQWWWEVRYLDARGRVDFTTANELHLPGGRPVRLEMTAGDVINSLWVPRLNGKVDLVPGRTTVLSRDADGAGVFRGHCAEFCELQHTRMAFTVIAHEPRDFELWRAQQRAAVDSGVALRLTAGRAVFARSCAYCHSVRGANAAAQVAPDLTHIASRAFIAAGTLSNTRNNLLAWISDPQRVKPGVFMPRVPLTSEEREQLVDYLQSLR